MNDLIQNDIQTMNETIDILNETKQIGYQQINLLQQQNEQLNSIHSDLIDIDIEQQITKESLSKIHHPFGFHSFKRIFSKRKEKKTGKAIDKMDKKVKYQLQNEFDQFENKNEVKKKHSLSNFKNSKSNEKYQNIPNEIDQQYQEKLDIIEQSVDDLNYLANEINQELLLCRYQLEMNKEMIQFEEQQLERNMYSIKKVKK